MKIEDNFTMPELGKGGHDKKGLMALAIKQLVQVCQFTATS